jgi:hypothetical protein
MVYDEAVHFWYILRETLVHAIAVTGTPGGQVWKHFWGLQQRFFRLLAVSLKVPLLGFRICVVFFRVEGFV